MCDARKRSPDRQRPRTRVHLWRDRLAIVSMNGFRDTFTRVGWVKPVGHEKSSQATGRSQSTGRWAHTSSPRVHVRPLVPSFAADESTSFKRLLRLSRRDLRRSFKTHDDEHRGWRGRSTAARSFRPLRPGKIECHRQRKGPRSNYSRIILSPNERARKVPFIKTIICRAHRSSHLQLKSADFLAK